MKKMFQPFHLVTYSPWPILLSFSILSLLVSIVYWFNSSNFMFVFLSLLMMLLIMYQWWRDVVREGMFQGFHTNKVVQGLKMGMILFIVSEVFFFISVFWGYFHMFLSPSIEIGELWPPKNLVMFDPYLIPLLNTIILLSSGVTITWSHHSLVYGVKYQSILGLLYTLILGVVFTMFQLFEYFSASFTFNDSVYGSIFFMSTGFHGFHVLVGSLFLLVNLVRMINLNFSKSHHVGFEMAAWYWHFVDVVWLFLYILVYLWCY
uniref:cytochrome c oxidase subunit III n=1 Tax=Tassonia gloriae TaxID=3064207 RepID=UPI00286A2658|nr:cytochrome c oxidase subunit III [Tassonia gloriae]WKV28887.1 cytochrome c oxidase subunit III [Tassonia gloriae]